MSKSAKKRGQGEEKVPVSGFLRAVPYVNTAMSLQRRSDGSAVASIPIRKPRLLIPPLSWILPYSPFRRVELDPLGVAVLDLCRSRRSVEAIIEKFAADNTLTFRESQLAVGQFLRQLAQRGLVAIVGKEKDAEKR